MKRIAAHYLYTMETDEPIVDGFVEFDEDGVISRVGKCEDISVEKEYIDGIVMPGMVNAHCHLELSYLWKKFRKGTGMAGFIDQINEMRDNKSYEEKLKDIRTWMDKLWNQGVSAMGDISNCADSFGIKAASPLYTRTFLEVFGTEPEDSQGVIDSVLKLQEEAVKAGIDAAPTPHSVYTMSPELLTASSAEGLKSGFLSFHSEESPEEEEMLVSGSGKMYENRKRAHMSTPPVTGKSSLLYFLDRLKQAHPAPFEENILLVHEVCMDKEGMEAVKAMLRHPYVALCPMSNIFIHNALPPVRLMREEGMKLTVGTDSLSSNDDLNMVSELFCLQENFPEIPLGEMLGWASRNGAEFLGKEAIYGTLTPGKKPGLAAIIHLGKEGRLTTASYSYRLV